MTNEEIFIKANSALAEGNYDIFISYCTDDIKWENVGKSTIKGKAELLRYISSAYSPLDVKSLLTACKCYGSCIKLAATTFHLKRFQTLK